jgi:hypothetical protein
MKIFRDKTEGHTFPKYLSSLPVLSEVRVAMTFRTPIRNQQNLCFEISCIGEIKRIEKIE